jgi:hypothetical protein
MPARPTVSTDAQPGARQASWAQLAPHPRVRTSGRCTCAAIPRSKACSRQRRRRSRASVASRKHGTCRQRPRHAHEIHRVRLGESAWWHPDRPAQASADPSRPSRCCRREQGQRPGRRRLPRAWPLPFPQAIHPPRSRRRGCHRRPALEGRRARWAVHPPMFSPQLCPMPLQQRIVARADQETSVSASPTWDAMRRFCGENGPSQHLFTQSKGLPELPRFRDACLFATAHSGEASRYEAGTSMHPAHRSTQCVLAHGRGCNGLEE